MKLEKKLLKILTDSYDFDGHFDKSVAMPELLSLFKEELQKLRENKPKTFSHVKQYVVGFEDGVAQYEAKLEELIKET